MEKSSRNFMQIKVYKSLFHVEKSSRNFMQRKVYFMWRKVHGILCREKFISCGEKFTHFHGWFMVLVRQFLIQWFWLVVLHLKVLIPSIGFMVLCYYGFGPWYCERPMTIKEEGDHLAKHHLNYWISDNVLDLEYCDWVMVQI